MNCLANAAFLSAPSHFVAVNLSGVKSVMAVPSALDPLTKELVYIAVSITNSCRYCVHSHTAAARAKGMTDDMYADLLRVVATAGRTNQLLNGLQVPVDRAFDLE